MKATEYSKKQAACEAVVRSLKDLANGAKDLPQQFKERLTQLAAEIEGHDLEQYRPQVRKPFGEYTTLADLLMIIKDATGYERWEGVESTSAGVAGPDSEDFRDRYRIDVKDQDLKHFEFERPTNNSDDLYLIGIVAIPGRVWVSLNTGRVQWEMSAGGGPLVMNHQFADALKKELRNQGLA